VILYIDRMEKHDYKDIGEIINIGTGGGMKLKDLASLIKNIVDFEGEIKHNLSRLDGTPRKLLDVSRIKELGWEAKINLEEEIRKAYSSYEDGNF